MSTGYVCADVVCCVCVMKWCVCVWGGVVVVLAGCVSSIAEVGLLYVRACVVGRGGGGVCVIIDGAVSV